MCLDNKLSQKDRKIITDQIGQDGITVYKVVAVTSKGHYPPASHTLIPYDDGLNEAIQTQINVGDGKEQSFYQTGFHFFQTKKEAEGYLEYMEDLVINHYEELVRWIDKGETFHKKYKVIECKIKKSWITMIGRQANTHSSMATVIVAKKAVFPKFRPKRKSKTSAPCGKREAVCV